MIFSRNPSIRLQTALLLELTFSFKHFSHFSAEVSQVRRLIYWGILVILNTHIPVYRFSLCFLIVLLFLSYKRVLGYRVLKNWSCSNMLPSESNYNFLITTTRSEACKHRLCKRSNAETLICANGLRPHEKLCSH